MKDIIKAFDKLPLLVKILFALPVLDIIWAFYRLCRSLKKNNGVGVLLAIVMLILCPCLFWLVDIITLLVIGKVLWLD